ncbi:MAG: trehalose-phosphatase [Acidimicrobiales bacterium]
MATPDIDALLDPFRSAPREAGVITDFDGTLAPIVSDPREARPGPLVPKLLVDLSRRFGRVAVVSGRPAAFLLDRLGGDDLPDQLVLSGLYGLELVPLRSNGAPVVEVHAEATPWIDAIAAAATDAEAAAPDGVYVERKGLSVTLHVRNAPEHAGWAERWATERSTATGLAIHPGRRSWELRPPVRIDKGTVVDGLISGLAAALFAGDDVGDLPAFDALDRARDSGAHTVRIGVRSTEAPVELLDRADVVVDGPQGVVELFAALL